MTTPSAGAPLYFAAPEPWGALLWFYLFLACGALAGVAITIAAVLVSLSSGSPTVATPGVAASTSRKRFVNEAAPYSDVVHVMYDRNPNDQCIPAWLVVAGPVRKSRTRGGWSGSVCSLATPPAEWTSRCLG